jgi:hypothetical protein
MLAAATNVRAVGTQVADGISTTHYTGSFMAGSASDRDPGVGSGIEAAGPGAAALLVSPARRR